MSFFDKPISGQADNFDPTILIPFGGFGKGLSAGFSQITKIFGNAFKTEAQLVAERTTAQGGINFGKPFVGNKGFLDDILKFFTPKKTAIIGGTVGAGAATIPKIGLPTIGTGTKLLIGGTVASIPVTTGILSLSPGGQNLVTTGGGIAKDITGITADTSKFFQTNPLILVGLIALGAIVVLKK